MLNDIIRYIQFLNDQHGLSISIHSRDLSSNPMIDKLNPYNIHRNPYCLFITSDRQCHHKCIEMQQEIRQICQQNIQQKRQQEIFYTTCPCGVGQYIVPIEWKAQLLGFICVSGYREDINRCSEYALSNNLPEDMLTANYSTHLQKEKPGMDRVRLLVSPLGSMLAVLFVQNPQPPSDDSANSSLYYHMVSVIHANMDKKLTIDDIASMCHCSPSMASHLFKEKSGTTINRYLNHLRINKAKKLLTETCMSITDIAYSCGFSDANYFVYAFGRSVGTTPLRYRKVQTR